MLMTKYTKHLFYLLVATLFLGMPQAAPAQTGDDVFTVSDVRVDVTADNAVAAREKAFAEAQIMAFDALAEKLSGSSENNTPNVPDPSVISTMIKDFEVTGEQLSAVQYIGTYTFRFDGNAVRNHFNTRGVSYSDVESRPVLVLPFFESGTRMILWSDPNPWRDAWSRSGNVRGNGLVPIAVPLGDIQDISGIGDGQALNYDPIALRPLLDRYNAAEAVIIIARPTSQDGEDNPLSLDVMIYRTDRGSPEYVTTLKVTADEAGNPDSLYNRAVVESRSAIQSDWKAETAVNLGTDSVQTILLRAEFDTMQQWVETRQALKRVQGISEMKIKSVTPREAQVEITYIGYENRLRLALEQAELSLGTGQRVMMYDTLPTHTVRLKKYAPF